MNLKRALLAICIIGGVAIPFVLLGLREYHEAQRTVRFTPTKIDAVTQERLLIEWDLNMRKPVTLLTFVTDATGTPLTALERGGWKQGKLDYIFPYIRPLASARSFQWFHKQVPVLGVGSCYPDWDAPHVLLKEGETYTLNEGGGPLRMVRYFDIDTGEIRYLSICAVEPFPQSDDTMESEMFAHFPDPASPPPLAIPTTAWPIDVSVIESVAGDGSLPTRVRADLDWNGPAPDIAAYLSGLAPWFLCEIPEDKGLLADSVIESTAAIEVSQHRMEVEFNIKWNTTSQPADVVMLMAKLFRNTAPNDLVLIPLTRRGQGVESPPGCELSVRSEYLARAAYDFTRGLVTADGRYFIGWQSAFYIWDTREGTSRRLYPREFDAENLVDRSRRYSATALSHDGRYIAFSEGGGDTRVIIIDLETGEIVHQFVVEGASDPALGVTFSDDDTVIYARFYGREIGKRWAEESLLSFASWDLGSGEKLSDNRVPVEGRKEVELWTTCPGSPYFPLSNHEKGMMEIWDLRTGEMVRETSKSLLGGGLDALAITSGVREIAYAGGNGFGVIDLESGERRWERSTSWGLSPVSVSFSEDGSLLAVVNGNRELQTLLFDVESGKCLYSFPYPPSASHGRRVSFAGNDWLVEIRSEDVSEDAGPHRAYDYLAQIWSIEKIKYIAKQMGETGWGE